MSVNFDYYDTTFAFILTECLTSAHIHTLAHTQNALLNHSSQPSKHTDPFIGSNETLEQFNNAPLPFAHFHSLHIYSSLEYIQLFIGNNISVAFARSHTLTRNKYNMDSKAARKI